MVEKLDRESFAKTLISTTDQFDGNRVRDDLENNGMIVSHRPSGHSGMEWPKDNYTYSIFASGVWYAGKVGEDLRCATAEYGPEMVPGPFGSNSSDAAYKIWKVNKSDLLQATIFKIGQLVMELHGLMWMAMVATTHFQMDQIIRIYRRSSNLVCAE